MPGLARAWLSFGALAAVLAGCVNLPPTLERELSCPPARQPDHFGGADRCGDPPVKRGRPGARRPTASARELVAGFSPRDGQIIVNEQASATSLAIALIAEKFSPFTHAGLIVIDDGEPYVYEAMGAVLPLPWRPPTAAMGGGVRRVKLETFVKRSGIVAIYEPGSEVDRGALVRFARRMRREHHPFDGHYDPRDSSSYYCVEFVARALEAAGAPRFAPEPATRNPSMQVALRWLEIRTPEFLLAGALVDDSRRVAVLSAGYSPAEVERYFALKRELHRRFTRDQKLGHLFYWKGQSLRLRPWVDRFTDVVMRSDDDPRVLADREFGVIEEGVKLAEAR